MGEHFSFVNKTRHSVSGVPFEKIKDAILGKKYDLSLAFVGPAESRRITRTYKYRLNPDALVGAPTKASGKKDKTSNVLSFPLSKTSGEIIICPEAAKPYSIGYLFIHGLLHLKGHDHGGIMESEELRFTRRFDIAHP